MEGRPRLKHPLGNYIELNRDAKSGTATAMLKIPHWAKSDREFDVSFDDDDSSPPQTASSNSENSSLAAPDTADRGMADGGFNNDFTSAVLEQNENQVVRPDRVKNNIHHHHHHHIIKRGNGDGEEIEEEDEESSDFDDFSDGDEQVNIIQIVNGNGTQSEMNDEAKESGKTGDPPPQDAVTENEVSEIYVMQDVNHVKSEVNPSIGQCHALYDYEANLYDELTIKAGDVINIHDKQADGWWLGEISGNIGIFPATYVEEIQN